MTIGSALKQLRTKLGLTQAEMAAGIISVSFYSKVERDIHDIGTTELIELLNQHNIDVSTFFTTYISPKASQILIFLSKLIPLMNAEIKRITQNSN